MAKNSVPEWDATAANNTDVGGISIAEGMTQRANVNNAMREIMAQVKEAVASQGSDIASASTTDIGAATGQYVKVTGTTTITALGTVAAGTMRWVEFTGALTLTHNGTSLKLPTSANITTAAGDTACFVSLGSGNWKCLEYMRLDGTSVTPASTTVKGSVRYATDAEFLARTETAAVLTPSNLAAKPTFKANKNTTAQGSITGGDTADVKVTFGTEEWDVGSYFASSTWTPPAGKRRITVNIEWSSTNAVDNEFLYTKLYKNGSQHLLVAHKRNGTGGQGFNDSFPINANGTDTYEIYVRKSGAGDGEISGAIAATWLSGD